MVDPKRQAPGPRTRGPFGSLLPYRRDPAEFLLTMQRDHGEVVRMKFGPYLVHLVTDPDAVRRVLIENQGNYCRGRFYEQFKLVMGEGLLTTDGERWRAHRRAVQPAFARDAIRGIGPNVVGATHEMLSRWDDAAQRSEPVDLVTEALRVTLVTLSTSLFDYDIRPSVPMLKQVVEDSIETMFPHGYVREMLPRWLPTSRNRLVAANRRRLDQVVDDVRAAQPRRAGSLVDLTESARDPDGRPWTDQEIRDELLTIYLAGHETTATALCWTLHSIAQHRWVAEKLEAEVDQVLAGRDPTVADLDRLPYTQMVVQEALRLFPPIWLYPRDATGDDVLAGYHIPAGSSLLLSPFVSHRNPRIWENPEAFDPSRFDAAAERERPRMSYFPFGGGPRQCIGNTMALLELRMIVAMVVSRYRFELVPGSFVRYGDSLISMRPTPDMLLRLRPRARSVLTGAAS
ncbi:cytochrome P450 [Actinoplanes aureus]|uniref:Cytochrome P450 n=1 Tax=Actinoplanes aureus TaxID=2792083 RepID=A0A931G5D8_9ACTN|nr:cytochrome P450 [Actinoplanes aureus]MBG0566144.1 cytochrome P450 [Actinoplanes aureus]